MAFVKVSETEISFPVVGFSRDDGQLWFGELWHLMRAGRYDVEKETLIGMEMVDNAMRRWIVRSLDLAEPLKPRRWWQIFGGQSYADFDLTLEELEPLSFADVKERIIADCEEIEELEAVEPAARARDLNELSDALYHQRTGLF
ncbi:hypothetical protein O4H52_17350 [Sphingomonadaceae bacterium G21617-S1]|nr:hypothetical protein [Sphingomonadaceae bacterium G21617-S1]